ncbi:MAG: hypothetical protein QM757_14775 [Paludibaculum sp.]
MTAGLTRKAWLPFEPLWRAARVESDLPPSNPGSTDVDSGFSARWFARFAGTSMRQVARWQHENRIPLDIADRLAIVLGLHPALLWPDQWAPVVDDDWDDLTAWIDA